MSPYLQAGGVRWALPLLLVAMLAGCTMPPSTTQSEVYVHGEPAFPVPVPSAAMPWPGDPRERITPVIDLSSSWMGEPSAPPVVPRAIGYNGGFEEGEGGDVPGWPATGDVRRDAALSRSGSASLLLAPGAMATQTIGGVSSGEVAWLKLHYVGDGVSVLRMTLYALDGQRTAIAGVYTNHSTGFAWSDVELGPLEFPARTQHVQIVLSVDEGGRQGAHVDDLEVAIAQTDGSAFVNGGFEEGRDGWDLASHAQIDCGFAFAREGECALRLDHGQGGGATQRIGVAGAAVSYSFTYTSQVLSWSDRTLTAELAFLDASGASVREPYVLSARLGHQGWIDSSSELVPIPPGTATLVLRFEANVAEAGPTWVDDVRVVWS